MPRRASSIWPEPDDDHPARLIGWKGVWATLQAFGWHMLERQSGLLHMLRYPIAAGEGERGLLVLSIHPQMEDLCRQLGARAGLTTQKLTLQPRELDRNFSPFSLRSIELPAAPKVRWLPRISPEAERSATTHTGLYVLVDTADARYAQHLLTETSVDVEVYALRHTCATYCRIWPALAHAFATHGVTLRPAHGYPHGSMPLAAVSETDGITGDAVSFTFLSRTSAVAPKPSFRRTNETLKRHPSLAGLEYFRITPRVDGWSAATGSAPGSQDHQRRAQPERALSLGGQRRRESIHRDPAATHATRELSGELTILDEYTEFTQEQYEAIVEYFKTRAEQNREQGSAKGFNVLLEEFLQQTRGSKPAPSSPTQGGDDGLEGARPQRPADGRAADARRRQQSSQQ